MLFVLAFLRDLAPWGQAQALAAFHAARERLADREAAARAGPLSLASALVALARSYGDLRENHEYKAAKEMQKQLMKQKDHMESELVRARGTDFSNVRTDVASAENCSTRFFANSIRGVNAAFLLAALLR